VSRVVFCRQGAAPARAPDLSSLMIASEISKSGRSRRAILWQRLRCPAFPRNAQFEIQSGKTQRMEFGRGKMMDFEAIKPYLLRPRSAVTVGPPSGNAAKSAHVSCPGRASPEFPSAWQRPDLRG